MENIPLTFDEKKTAQAAGYFLRKSNGEMKYLKLLKLLYLADRESLLSAGRPITCDCYVSMDHGPVLSKTYDLISHGTPALQKSFWLECISSPSDYNVKLMKDPGQDRLSEAELRVMEKIFSEYGHWEQWELVDKVMHQLPEWENPTGSSIPIAIHDILKAGGKTDVEIASIEHELESLAVVRQFLHP